LDFFSATAIATIVATAISFVASRYWTFRHRDRSGARRETVLFFTVNGIGVGISEGVRRTGNGSGRLRAGAGPLASSVVAIVELTLTPAGRKLLDAAGPAVRDRLAERLTY
jgi:hypothetical protein